MCKNKNILKSDPCEHCGFGLYDYCDIDNDNFCYGLHGEYKITNNGLNAFYNIMKESYTETCYEGKHDCMNCKYYDYKYNLCNIDDQSYYNTIDFDCLYLDDNNELTIFGKQVILSRKL